MLLKNRLLNDKTDGLHVWDLESMNLMRKKVKKSHKRNWAGISNKPKHVREIDPWGFCILPSEKRFGGIHETDIWSQSYEEIYISLRQKKLDINSKLMSPFGLYHIGFLVQ